MATEMNTTDSSLGLNVTEAYIEEPAMETNIAAVVIPIVFALVFLAGVVGNSTLIFTVLRNKSMRNTPNILVVSLAAGDCLLLLFSVPFTSTIYTVTSWPFGDFVCKLNEYVQTFSVGVSVFTLTALSGDRYIAIVHPMSKHTGKPTLITWVTVVAIWGFALACAIPELLVAKVEHIPLDEVVNGTNSTPNFMAMCFAYRLDLPTWAAKTHVMAKFIVFFVVPLFIIGIFYGLMANILIISSRSIPCETMTNSMMNHQQKRQVEARHKVAKVVLSFVVIFVVCWLPRHVYLLFYYFSPGEFNMFWYVFKICGFCLTYIYSCVNPYALYFLSSQYRRYYNRYLLCCCPTFRYRSLGQEQSTLYNFNSTVRRGSTTLTGVVHSQSMC